MIFGDLQTLFCKEKVKVQRDGLLFSVFYKYLKCSDFLSMFLL